MSFLLTALCCLLLLGFIFSRVRARRAGKQEIPKLFE
jgi:hypothetical protein